MNVFGYNTESYEVSTKSGPGIYIRSISISNKFVYNSYLKRILEKSFKSDRSEYDLVKAYPIILKGLIIMKRNIEQDEVLKTMINFLFDEKKGLKKSNKHAIIKVMYKNGDIGTLINNIIIQDLYKISILDIFNIIKICYFDEHYPYQKTAKKFLKQFKNIIDWNDEKHWDFEVTKDFLKIMIEFYFLDKEGFSKLKGGFKVNKLVMRPLGNKIDYYEFFEKVKKKTTLRKLNWLKAKVSKMYIYFTGNYSMYLTEEDLDCISNELYSIAGYQLK